MLIRPVCFNLTIRANPPARSYMKDKKTTLEQTAKVLQNANNIGIITHMRPDCDALGSALGLARALNDLGKSAQIYSSDPVPSKYLFLPGAEHISSERMGEHDLTVSVDCSDSNRMGMYRDAFIRTKNTLNIDHHMSNSYEGKFNFVLPQLSSCSQMILMLVNRLGLALTPEIAFPLYFGLASDTGNFAHSNTTAESFLAAAELKSVLGDVSEYVALLFKDNPKPRFLLMAHTMSAARFFSDDRICILTVRRADIEHFGAEDSMTEGFVEQAVNCTPVEVGICVLESEKGYKISFRSKGSVDVCEIASLFGGGGHIRASGCMLHGFYEDVIDKLVKAASDRLPL